MRCWPPRPSARFCGRSPGVTARQLDKVAGELLGRAWAAGAGPSDGAVTIDVDSSICETYGLAKQGGAKFTYNHVRGYHPLFAVMAGTGDVVHCRLRGGNAHAGRGAAGFLTETFNRVRAAGATGPLVLRADSGFYSRNVVDACGKADVRFSITAKLHKGGIHKAIAAIDESAWVPIPYFLDGAAVAETTYRPFGAKGRPCRLIVRRVRPTPGSQLALFAEFSYHAFITDRPGAMLDLEADHRRHAEIENTIRDLKYGVGLNHLPSGRFGANAAWLALNVIAHNLARWTSRIGLGETLIATDTIRRHHLAMPGRLTRSARRRTLHLPQRWPWADAFDDLPGQPARRRARHLSTSTRRRRPSGPHQLTTTPSQTRHGSSRDLDPPSDHHPSSQYASTTTSSQKPPLEQVIVRWIRARHSDREEFVADAEQLVRN